MPSSLTSLRGIEPSAHSPSRTGRRRGRAATLAWMPESERVFVVPENARGWRIDRFLAECFPKHSRRSLMRVVKAGVVLVDGRRTRPGILLEGGERVSLPPLEEATEAAKPERAARPSREIEVLHRDADLLVVNKPPN